MNPTERILRQEWRRLRSEHPALQPVSFNVNGRLRRKLGHCRFRFGKPYEIEVARSLTLDPRLQEQALETLRHEAAHALAGYEAGHGPEWKRWASRLGARPTAACRSGDLTTDEQRALRETTARQAKWTVGCRECVTVGHRHRAAMSTIRGSVCGKCGGQLRWKDNKTGRVYHGPGRTGHSVNDPFASCFSAPRPQA